MVANKYYLIILLVFLLAQIFTATLNMGIYFMTYILGDANLLGVFAWAINAPLIIGLLFTPFLVKRFGEMYRVNITGYVIAVVGRLGVLVRIARRTRGRKALHRGAAPVQPHRQYR